jgi:hypothetical protein
MALWDQILSWNAIAFLRKLFRRPQPPQPSALEAPEPAAPIEPPIAEEKYQPFTVRGVLDTLDLYWTALRHMRKSDPDTFALFSKVGIWLLDETMGAHRKELSPWWRKNRPTFGAVSFSGKHVPHLQRTNNKQDYLVPRFIYFNKFDAQLAPPIIERTNRGDVYVCSVFFADDKKGWSAPVEFALVVTADNECGVLRRLLRGSKPIRATHGRDRGGTFTIPVQRWGIHEFFRDWAAEHHQAVSDFLVQTFILAANFFEHARYGMAEVRVAKDNMVANFNIDIKDTSRFFRERTTMAEDGKKRRIFHIVRAHERANGSVVRFHFRGERQFGWKGYQVQITVPGLHKRDIGELQGGAGDESQVKPKAWRSEWMDMQETGEIIADAYTKAKTLPNKQSFLRGLHPQIDWTGGSHD